jgi:iron(III) transport system permease protein
MRAARRVPGLVLSAIVALLLGVFIAWPIGAMLHESTRISGPMPPERLRAATEQALATLPEPRRAETVTRWLATMTERQRIEAIALAARLSGRKPWWDTTAAYSEQAAAVKVALQAVDPAIAAEIVALTPLAHIMLHRRVALAFQARNALDPQAFESLRSGEEHRRGLDHYASVFRDPFLRAAAINSLSLAAVSAVFTTILAFLLSYGINRGYVPRPGLTRGMLLMPLVAPPVLISSALIMLFGRRGLITSGLLDQTFGLIDAETMNVYGPVGVAIAQILAFLPAALIVLDDVMRKQDGRLEEAAASLGAGRGSVFVQVTLPMASPGIRRVAVLAFIMSLTDFGNPLILGRDTPVLAGIVYEEVTAFRNTPLAAALCVWLLVPPLLIFLALEAMGGRRRFTAQEGGTAIAEAPPPAPLRWLLSALALVVAGLIAVIYLTVIAGAFVRLWGVDWTPTLGFFTPEGVNVGFQGTGYGSSERGLAPVWTSLQIALAAAIPGSVLGLLTAVVVERIRPPGHRAIAFLAMIPAILPGIIFGVGYIVAFHVPFGFKELSLTGTGAILVLNIAFGNLFVGMLAARAALQRADPALDEAGESLGAGMIARLRLITLPLLKPAFLLGGLYVFVDGLTTLSSVIFLISGDHKLAAVAIFNHASSGEFGYAAAKSLALLLFAGLAMALVARLERKGARGRSPDHRRQKT